MDEQETEKLTNEKAEEIHNAMNLCIEEMRESVDEFLKTVGDNKRKQYNFLSALICTLCAESLHDFHVFVNAPIFKEFLKSIMQDFDSMVDCPCSDKCNSSSVDKKFMKIDANSEEGQAILKKVLSDLTDK